MGWGVAAVEVGGCLDWLGAVWFGWMDGWMGESEASVAMVLC